MQPFSLPISISEFVIISLHVLVCWNQPVIAPNDVVCAWSTAWSQTPHTSPLAPTSEKSILVH